MFGPAWDGVIPAESPRPRSRDLWLCALGAAALALLFAQTWTRAHRPGGIDLTTYLEAARASEHGQSPYGAPAAFPYIYPPFFAFALIPLAHLPADLVLAIWFAASVGAIVWSLWRMLRLAYPELRARSLTPFLAVVFAAAYTVVQSNLRNAQVNFLIVGLAVVALDARGASRRAIGWALAIAIKIVPSVLTPFYLVRRQWRLCAIAAAAVVVLCLMPVITLGAQAVPLTVEYLRSFVGGSFGAAGGSLPLDFSLGGMLALIAGSDGRWLRLIGAAVPIAAVVAADVRAARTSRVDALAFALYLAVIPLASPKSEIHHLAFALPAAALAFGAAWFRVDRRRLFLALLGVTLAGYLAAVVVGAWSGPLFFVSLVALAGAITVLMNPAPLRVPPGTESAK